MANIKSSAKRALIGKERAARNKAAMSKLRTMLKKFDIAATEGNRENAQAAFVAAVSAVDHAVSIGLIHKNNAAHKKSGMAQKLNAIAE